jgi:hypothetical protein
MDLWNLCDLCTPWCVHVAATLRVAEHIESGRKQIAELAEAAGAHPESLSRVLRHLVEKGVFTEPAPGRFELNDTARGLLDSSVRLGLNLDSIGGRMAHAWGTMLSAVRRGEPAYGEVFGCGFWEDLERHPGIAADLDALMGPAGHGAPDPEVVLDPAGWDSVQFVVDVGGGTGSLLAHVLQKHPHLRGTLVDLPRTVARSAEIFRDAGVSERATTAGQSFFDPLPAGADLYLLKNVLADWADEPAALLLQRCADAARPNG